MTPAQIEHVAFVPGVLPERSRLKNVYRAVVPVQLPHAHDRILPRRRQVLARVRKLHRPHRILVRADGLNQPSLGELFIHLSVHQHLDLRAHALAPGRRRARAGRIGIHAHVRVGILIATLAGVPRPGAARSPRRIPRRLRRG